MKTIKLSFFLFLLISISQLNAQQANSRPYNNKLVNPPIHELGLRFRGLNNLDFIYKKQKSENKFTRYRVGGASFSFQERDDIKYTNFTFELAIGREKRTQIADRLQFVHGLEPSISWNLQSNRDQYDINLRPGIGYVLGFQFDISNKFYVNMETIPSLTTNFDIDNDGFREGFTANAGFNSNAIALSLVYRFNKK